MPEILIIGAGLGGLTLANALQKTNPSFGVRVLERDRDSSSRRQGYYIGLNQEGGLWAMRELGLGDRIQAAGRVTGLRFTSPDGKKLLDLPLAPPESRYFTLSIARSVIRSSLLESLEPETVCWNSRCTGYAIENGKPAAILDDGSRLRADVIVACDGVNSAIRKQMLGDPKRYLGLSTVGGVVRQDVSHSAAHCGSFMALGRGMSFFFAAFDDRSYLWAFTMQAKEMELATKSAAELKAVVLQATKGWHEPIQDVVRRTDDSDLGAKDLYDRAPPTRVIDGAVVLLGDAAHPMSPFRGQGGNSAMVDGIKLAAALTGSGPEPRALMSYASEMMSRARPLVRTSFRAAKSLHTTNSFSAWKRNFGYRLMDWVVNRKS